MIYCIQQKVLQLQQQLSSQTIGQVQQQLQHINQLLWNVQLSYEITVPLCTAFRNRRNCNYGNNCYYRHIISDNDNECKMEKIVIF